MVYSTLHCTLQCTFSLVHMKVTDSDILAWVQGQGRRVKYWAHL
jgi:hypothetical protein